MRFAGDGGQCRCGAYARERPDAPGRAAVYRLLMAQDAEFEEKEFEGALNAQLCLGGPYGHRGRCSKKSSGLTLL